MLEANAFAPADGCPRAVRPGVLGALRAPPVLAGGALLVALTYDSSAPAADPKRVLMLFMGASASSWLAVAAPAFASGTPPLSRAARWVAVPVCALVLWSALSLLWGKKSGTLDLGPWVAAVAIGMVVARTARDHAEKLVRVVLGGGGLLLAIVYLVQATVYGRAWAHGFQGNPDWLGLVLAPCLPVLVAGATCEAHPKRERLVSALGAALVAVTFVLASARAGFLAAVVGTVCVCVLRRGRRSRLITVAVAAATLGVTLVFASKHGSGGASGFHDQSLAASLGLRGRLVKLALSAARDTPVVGHGLGGFHEAFLAAQGAAISAAPLRVQEALFVNATTAHCDAAQVLVETGLIGAGCLSVFVIAVLRAVRGRVPSLVGALVASLVSLFLDASMRQPTAILFLAVATGALCAQPVPASRALASRAPAWPGCLAKGVPCLLLLASVLSVVPAVRVWYVHRALREHGQSPERPMPTRWVSLSSWDPSMAFALATRAEVEGRFPEARELAALCARERPEPTSLLLLGNVAREQGDDDAARTAYLRVLAMHPGSYRAHVNLASLDLRIGLREEAARHAERARALRPSSPQVRALVDELTLAAAMGWNADGTCGDDLDARDD